MNQERKEQFVFYCLVIPALAVVSGVLHARMYYMNWRLEASVAKKEGNRQPTP